MKVRQALFGLGVVTILYLLALIWADSRNQVFTELPKLIALLPVLMGLSLLSYSVRYLRWHWLLGRSGSGTKMISGYLAYMAGFAFSATPGKVGELLRIRYLVPQGVPAWRVLSAFIYERAFDLVAVLLLSALAINRMDIFVYSMAFVLFFLGLLVAAALNPTWLTKVSMYLSFYRFGRLARILMTLRNGLTGCRVWVTWLDVSVSFGLGLLAWCLTSLSFVWLLIQLGLSIPTFSALAIYPLSMLAGAASMIPGGVGSTEVTIVALLSLFGVSIGTATLAAIGIRFASMWFAVACGFIAVAVFELFYSKTPPCRSQAVTDAR